MLSNCNKLTSWRAGAMVKFAMAALMLATVVIGTAPVRASDLDFTQPQIGGEQGTYLRMGLNKSAVIRLPADARDVIVGNDSIVDAVIRTKNVAYLFAHAVGQTNIFFFDANGQQILALDLEVAMDLTALQKSIRRAIPGTAITVDTINNNVILGGTASSTDEAKTAEDIAKSFVSTYGSSVVNTIALSGKDQVMLKVRVVELQRDVLKQFGIDSQAIFKAGKFAFNLSNLFPFSAGVTGALHQGGFKIDGGSGGDAIGGVVRAMERDALLRTLAEPTLTAISGESAKFLAGGEFPVPKTVDDKGTVTYEYKPFGVGLSFTPVVLAGGRVSLKISTEVSNITSNGSATAQNFILPGIEVRRAETTVEMSSGGTMMLAGLIKDSTRQHLDGTPGLKKLPVLGALFRSRDYISNQTELVVLVTPYIVNQNTESAFATPADGFNVATDRQTVLFGRLNKVYGANKKSPTGAYHGNVGFIVE